MKEWISNNRRNNKPSVLIAYSLGKTQRILQTVAESTDHIFAHGAVYNTQQALIQAGWKFPEVKRVTPDIPKEVLQQSVVLAPSGADASPWIRRFIPYSVGVCSGWMQVRGNVRRRNVDAGFALSDHADWTGLLDTIKATGAQMVYVTHGFQSALSRYLNEIGIPSAEVKTEYGEEEGSDLSEEPSQVSTSSKSSDLS